VIYLRRFLGTAQLPRKFKEEGGSCVDLGAIWTVETRTIIRADRSDAH
jgi:hypothetical protein